MKSFRHAGFSGTQGFPARRDRHYCEGYSAIRDSSDRNEASERAHDGIPLQFNLRRIDVLKVKITLRCGASTPESDWRGMGIVERFCSRMPRRRALSSLYGRVRML